MVKISALNGITYNLDKIDINGVIAPPYDVISGEEREKLYGSSPYNVVRLILGRTLPFDNEKENQYTRAANFFEKWMDHDILIKSGKPCIYYYIQTYTTQSGNLVSRKGFIAKNYIEEYSKTGIMPHEYTMGGPKEDRLKLTKACKANFSQIFMLYSDPEHAIDKAVELPDEPFIDVTDNQGIRNIVYIIDKEDIINEITGIMEDKSLLIADGHHRYETALNYRNYMRENEQNYSENNEFDWVMCYYTNLDDENLQVHPTHRIITQEVSFEKLKKQLKEYFDVIEYPFDKSNQVKVKEQFNQDLESSADENIVFGIRLAGIDRYFLYKLREKEAVNKILEEKGIPESLRKFDLAVLHEFVITDFIDISKENQTRQNGIKYIKKENEAIEAVESGSAELAFLMASPRIQIIKEIVREGLRMPQKSTYFYPKLLSGLVINPLSK